MESFRYTTRGRRFKRLLGAALGKTLIGPQVVSLEITHHCNLRCSFCESHGILQAAPITSRRTYQGGRSTMRLETVQRLAGEMAEIGVDLVELSGKGDPISHPQLTEVVRALRAAGLQCAIVTNGTLARPDLAPTLVETGLGRLNVSLNAGSREYYLRSNHRDLWDKAIHFLRSVIEERNRRGSQYPWIRLSHVVSQENVEDFAGMVHIARDLGVNEVTFYAMGELPESQHLQLTGEQVGGIQDRLEEYVSELNGAGISHTLEKFARDLSLRVRHGAPVQSNPLQERIPCYEGWVFCVIGPDGTVVPCCYCEETHLGNVTDTSFVEIWYGALYRQFRNDSLNMPKSGRWICRECFTSCNKAQDNLHIHNRIRPLRKTREGVKAEIPAPVGSVSAASPQG